MLSEHPKQVQPYVFHGLDLTSDEEQAKGDCPFCDAPDRFFVKVETGQYTCHRCKETGNVHTFLQTVYSLSYKAAEDNDYKELAANRGIPASTLRRYGIVPSIIDHEWLIPAYNGDGKLANLSKVVITNPPGKTVADNYYLQPASKLTILSTPGCKQHPFGMDMLLGINPDSKINKRKNPARAPKVETLFVCEGFWDGAAFLQKLIDAQAATIAKPTDAKSLAKLFPFPFDPATSQVIAAPGCQTFNADWCRYFDARNVVILFDNDHPKDSTAGKTVQPGWQAYDRLVALAASSDYKPKSLHVLNWGKGSKDKRGDAAIGYDTNLPSGYDIRDLINQGLNPSQNGHTKSRPIPKGKAKPTIGYFEFFTALAARLEPRSLKATKAKASPKKKEVPEVPELEPYPRSSFAHLCKDYDTQHYHLNQQAADTLSVMLAVVLSTQLPGDQVWLRVIGPPGSGKTTFAETISCARRYVYPLSTFRGIHSGYVDYNDKGGEDNSLIKRMNGKTVIIKDGDTLCNIPNRDQVLSEMRDYFDGTSRAQYRNKLGYDYGDIRTTFIICGTDDLRSLSRSSAGERFLDIEILGGNSHKPYLDKALDATLYQLTHAMAPEPDEEISSDKLLYLKRCTLGFLQHFKGSLDRREIEIPDMSKDAQERIKALGQLIAFMRARVKRTGKEIAYRPRIELPTRLASQLAKLAICLAIVHSKKSIDAEIIRIIRQVVIGTSEGFQFDITKALASSPLIPNPDLPDTPTRKTAPEPASGRKGSKADLTQKKAAAPVENPLLPKRIPAGMSALQLSNKLHLAETNVRNTLSDMLEYGIVRRSEEGNRSGQRGRNRHVWQLSPELLALYRFALLDK